MLVVWYKFVNFGAGRAWTLTTASISPTAHFACHLNTFNFNFITFDEWMVYLLRRGAGYLFRILFHHARLRADLAIDSCPTSCLSNVATVTFDLT